MARILMTLLGLILLALGIWAGIVWWSAVLPVLQALLVIILVIFGITLLVFGISELSGARSPTAPVPSPQAESEE